MPKYMGVEYNAATYADVPEPTEAELAEIDAALALAEVTAKQDPEAFRNAEAWFQSWPVQAAFMAVGPVQPTAEWTYQFATFLLGATDTKGDLRLQEMQDAVATWEWHFNRHAERKGFTEGKRSGGARAQRNFFDGMPVEIPRLLLTRKIQGRKMSFDHCAWLLAVTPVELERVLWPRTDRDALSEAANELQTDRSLRVEDVAKGLGLGKNTLRDFMNLRYGYDVKSGGRQTPRGRYACTLSDEAFEEAMGWVGLGLSPTEAHQRLIDLGRCDARYRYNSFYSRMRRSQGAKPQSQRRAAA